MLLPSFSGIFITLLNHAFSCYCGLVFLLRVKREAEMRKSPPVSIKPLLHQAPAVPLCGSAQKLDTLQLQAEE
jgi:hypothetical protein